VRIVGYTDRWSVAPTETVRFMVSSQAERYQASIVRLLHGDRKEGWPGLKVRPVQTQVDGEYPGREQRLPLGSYALVEGVPAFTGAFAVEVWIYPTAPGPTLQGIVTRWRERDSAGWGLFLEPEGDLSLRVGKAVVRTWQPLRPFAWYRVEASYDPAGNARVSHEPARRQTLGDTAAAVEEEAPPASESDVPLVFAGHVGPDGPIGRFNGKIDSPSLRSAGDILGAWDFAADPDTDRIRDRSGNGLDGKTVNMPMRAMTGWSWTGREIDFKNAPEEYGAVFFHDDDLEDARWEADFELAVPESLPSGVYAAWLHADDGAEEWLPFFVRPARGTATAPIAVLMPTLSYLAYANEHAALSNPVAVADFPLWDYFGPEDHLAMAAQLLGLYDRHRDGVGVCYSSRLRPVVNMRPHYQLALIRSAHQFPADLHLVDWLDVKGFETDVITDEDLHEDGLSLLARYRVVLTGSHPEYWTVQMLDALESYLGEGGRLMYLGGNGFYWTTSIDPHRRHVIEVRRGRRGTGTWRGEPGEDFHSTTGEPGGLWRDRGRPPQRLVGVGMAAQGFDRGLPYHREPGCADPRASWILEGVGLGPIGDFGLVMGGAAGLELDRADPGLGTPPHAVVIASAQGFSDSYQHVVEEVVSSDSKQGGSVSPHVRGDMVFFETPNGGAVFSVGSIAWCGSLSHNDYENGVSRITENVLRRFASDDRPSPSVG
jgi:N,N-dimethylformamidase beta subunit-like, C-terminal